MGGADARPLDAGPSAPALPPAAFTVDDAPVESDAVELARVDAAVALSIRTELGTLAFHFEVDSLGVEGGLSVGFHSQTLPNTAAFTAVDGTLYSSELGEAERFGMAFLAFEDRPGGRVDARFGGALRSADGDTIDIDRGRVSGTFPPP